MLTIRDRLKDEDVVILTRCYQYEGKSYEIGEYKASELPMTFYEQGLVITKPIYKEASSKSSEVPSSASSSDESKTKKTKA